jgi:hypothetical protein
MMLDSKLFTKIVQEFADTLVKKINDAGGDEYDVLLAAAAIANGGACWIVERGDGLKDLGPTKKEALIELENLTLEAAKELLLGSEKIITDYDFTVAEFVMVLSNVIMSSAHTGQEELACMLSAGGTFRSDKSS